MTYWMRHQVIGLVMLVACLGGGAAGAFAQQGGADGDSQLGAFIGKWSETGQSRSTPTAAFGSLTGDETCAWFSGGPSVVCRETTKDGSGEVDGIYILGYDASRKVYTMAGTDNNGALYSGTGTVEKDVWHWTAEMRAGGAVTPMRYTFRAAGSGARTMDAEVATGKGAFAKVTSVTYKRAK